MSGLDKVTFYPEGIEFGVVKLLRHRFGLSSHRDKNSGAWMVGGTLLHRL